MMVLIRFLRSLIKKVLGVLVMKYNIFSTFTLSRIRIFPDRIRFLGRSGSGLRKKVWSGSGGKNPDPKHCILLGFGSAYIKCRSRSAMRSCGSQSGQHTPPPLLRPNLCSRRSASWWRPRRWSPASWCRWAGRRCYYYYLIGVSWRTRLDSARPTEDIHPPCYNQCWGSGSRILAQFGSGSRAILSSF